MDIEELPLGASMQSYPVDEMILSLAKGIAKAQNEMDMASLETLKARSDETLDSGADSPTLLELGLFPAFFKFEETIIDISVEISMRVEDSSHFSFGVEGKVEGQSSKTSAMVAASVNLEKSRRYGLDMSGATQITAVIRSQGPPARLLQHFGVETE